MGERLVTVAVREAADPEDAAALLADAAASSALEVVHAVGVEGAPASSRQRRGGNTGRAAGGGGGGEAGVVLRHLDGDCGRRRCRCWRPTRWIVSAPAGASYQMTPLPDPASPQLTSGQRLDVHTRAGAEGDFRQLVSCWSSRRLAGGVQRRHRLASAVEVTIAPAAGSFRRRPLPRSRRPSALRSGRRPPRPGAGSLSRPGPARQVFDRACAAPQ